LTTHKLSRKERERLLANLSNEQNGVALYKALAEAEKNPQLAEVYRRLAATEQRHVETFKSKLKDAGIKVPDFRPSWRTSTLVWLAKRFGVKAVLPTVMSIERAATVDYGKETDAKTKGMIADEQSHARLIKYITQSAKGGLEGGALARMEGRHRAAGGNALRAAVLGANDGLVSNLSLVMGVAGAALSGSTILITGLAGLLAGATSMALGEWLSVQSSRESYEAQIAAEQEEIETSPKEEEEELALIYQAKGLDAEQAKILAEQIMSDKENALDTLAREELGIDPKELGGSAWIAAITSFFLFGIGAIIPVIPFFFLQGYEAIVTSLVFSVIGLFAIGAGTSLFTGRSVLFSGSRMVLFGLAAAAITYGIGRLIGINLS
jgi:vacuolar iron transporter family protein